MTLAEMQGIDLRIYRLPNVFGKWSRPNYNSAIATFCHNVARNLPLTIHDPRARLRLVYIDDVIDTWLNGLSELSSQSRVFHEIHPVYESTVGEVAEVIEGFRNARATLMPGEVGAGFMRALYATYLSFVPPEDFAYSLTRHEDQRGVFVEMLRTQSAGQFSFFTAHPGITRGGHYHHTKSEKFLVIQGTARFRFRHVVSGEESTLEVRGEQSRVVETVPGWSHDITNIGDTELIVMLWANERFDRDKPDTVAMPL
jgi:UDP-2-acetamido-2,6-beta-L-arabino-hexul-4-ose reductase